LFGAQMNKNVLSSSRFFLMLLWQVERKGAAGHIGDGITSPSDILGDEQIQQWRAQSMHQLQELELMNQALRSTLNRQTSGLPTGMCSLLISYRGNNFLGCKGHDVCRMSSCRVIILFSADEICEFSTG